MNKTGLQDGFCLWEPPFAPLMWSRPSWLRWRRKWAPKMGSDSLVHSLIAPTSSCCPRHREYSTEQNRPPKPQRSGEVLLTEGTGHCKDGHTGTYPPCPRNIPTMPQEHGGREKEEGDESQT